MLPNDQRKRAFLIGAAGVAAAAVWFIGAAMVVDRMELPPATLRLVMLGVFAVAVAFAVVGVWQLARARDQQWDGWGIGAFLLLFPGYGMVFLFSFSTVMSVMSLLTDQTGGLYGK